ncbi:hypothetical protein F5B21DRAFT_479943 [Xylaria acuta]|nr:hypothetical protein F5B21DRAFT_479943 [Xylaria acuta]
MATNSPAGLKPFDKGDLKYIRENLCQEAINPRDVLQDAIHYDLNEIWEDITSWIGGLESDKYLLPDTRFGKPITAAIWERSQDFKFTIKGLSPIFIFLTVPDPITDIGTAWRSLLCTLICEISDFISRVPSEKLSESGVHGGQFVRKYFNRDGQQRGGTGGDTLGSDDADQTTHNVNALIELLSALQHCEFETGYQVKKNGGTAEVKYVYVVVIDSIKRLSKSSDADYLGSFKEALGKTVATKMGGYILFIDEKEGN